VAAAGIAVAGPAQAAKWVITPSASVTESFTDNFGLRNDSQDRNSELVTTVTPAISVRGTGGRANLAADYTYERLFHLRESERNGPRNSLNATGSAELWDKVFFMDGAAQISQQVANTLGPVSQSQANLGVNTVETRTWSLGPRFLHHLGTWAETISTIKHTELSTSQDSTIGTPTTATGSPIAGKTTTNQTRFVMNSGRRFTQVLWSVTTDQTKTSREDLPHRKDTLGRVDLTYVVNRQMSLLAGVGWQWIDDESVTNEPKGPIWSIGTEYRPGRRTTLRFNYNHQYDNEFFTYSGVYNISPRTSFHFDHTDSVQTSSQPIQDNLAFIGIGPGGELIDLRTGAPYNPALNPTGLQDETIRFKVWTAGFNSQSGRNNYGLHFARNISTTERTGQEVTQNAIVATFSRQLSRRTTGRLSANYRISESTEGTTPTAATAATQGASTNLLISGGLAYTLTPEMSLDFTVNMNRFSIENSDNDVRENAASITLRRTF
jgi:uncharacterized protein (PEP-CTERM system associated)